MRDGNLSDIGVAQSTEHIVNVLVRKIGQVLPEFRTDSRCLFVLEQHVQSVGVEQSHSLEGSFLLMDEARTPFSVKRSLPNRQETLAIAPDIALRGRVLGSLLEIQDAHEPSVAVHFFTEKWSTISG